MKLPAPFGYAVDYAYVETVTGDQRCIPGKIVPIQRPHEPVFLEWQRDIEGFTSDICLVCGHDRYDEMHNPMNYAEY